MTNQAPMTNDHAMPKVECRTRNWSLALGHLFAIGAWSLVIAGAGCERTSSSPISAKSPRVASLVPAATDLLVGMGAADHLVAVSNWDTSRDPIRQLPRVGDYQSTDWEKLAELKPDIMIVFMAGDRMPAGLKQRADQLKIRLVNIQTDRLDEIFRAIDLLGALTNEHDKANELSRRLQKQLDGVAGRVQGRAKVPTLIARDEEGFALIAGNTFVDDLLTIAGGTNVAGHLTTRYPTIDREKLVELSPQAIVQLMPDTSPQVLERAHASWAKVPELPAVSSGRVHILTDWYVLQPGSHVGDLAQKLAELLHPPDTAH
jgi:iron complex transport system substrate-binding protein